MPTYQYACTACGHRLEAVQSFTDEALTECPACEGRLRKLFSGVGVVFKGSGFYRTDSRAAASSSSSSSGSNGGNGNGSGGSSSGAKPADKPSSPSSTPAAKSSNSSTSSSTAAAA